MRIAFKPIAPIVAAAALAFASAALAQGPGLGMGQGPRGSGPGTGPVAQHCQDDIEKLCEGLEHGGRAIRTCLEKNKSKLSSACKSALDSTGPGRRFQ